MCQRLDPGTLIDLAQDKVVVLDADDNTVEAGTWPRDETALRVELAP